MSHIGFRYTYYVLCADVLSSLFKTCDFCVLTLEFHILSFPFCVLCYMFEDYDFLFRKRDKEIYSKCADGEMEKERVQRDKTGILIMLHFLQLAHPRHMAIYMYLLNSKHKSQNTEVTIFEHRTQNICTVYKTKCHI